jgi:hypothetical protein
MHVTPLESTTLRNVGYDNSAKVLRLEFRSRAVYFYFGVPVGVYQELLTADSKGAYFNGNIRSRFPYLRQDNGETK